MSGIDKNNILRVDLYQCYQKAEEISVYKGGGMDLPDNLIISEDDYGMLHTFVMEAASLIADHAGYITCAGETGLDALTNNACLPPCTKLEDVKESTKLQGESMDKDLKKYMIFNIEELDHVDLIRNSVVQQYIESAITRHLLYRWYETCGRNDIAAQEYASFESYKDKVRFNSVTNIKRKKIHRPSRPFG